MKLKILGALVAGMVIIISWVAWSTFQGFVIKSCDLKFGCVGQIQFAAFFSSIAAIITCFSFYIASSFPRLFPANRSRVKLIGTGAIGGVLLSFLLATVPRWGLETGGMVIGWLVANIVVFATFLFLMKLSTK